MMDGKTIKQIAEELGVSKQAVHQKRKNRLLSTALQPFTSTVDGIVYITVDGETLIKQAFSDTERKHVDVNEPTTVDGSVYRVLQTTIDTLQEQLAVKDKLIDSQSRQIDELTVAVRVQAESIGADRKNELAVTLLNGQQLVDNGIEKQSKQGFWGRFRKGR